MRNKKKELAPAAVETDFYTEALKAFDVVLPPSEEELEDLRRAEEEKARKRANRLRAVILAVVTVTVALVLWRPWESPKGPPITNEPAVNWPLPSETKLGFHIYTVPGSFGVSYIPYTGAWDFHNSTVDSMLEQLEALDWTPTALLSSIPAPTIGDLVIIRDGKEHKVEFNAYGILFAEGYMAKPDAALWDTITSLLRDMNPITETGRFVVELAGGDILYLDVNSDGSFVVIQDQGITYNGYWGRVADYLLLYTSEPRVGNDGGLTYLQDHDFWLLKELKGAGPLYPESTAVQATATMTVELNMPAANLEKTASVQLTYTRYDQLKALLESAQWQDKIISGVAPQMCGGVSITRKLTNGMSEATHIRFSHDGVLYDGLRYGRLSEEDWIAFVHLLADAGENQLTYRSYYCPGSQSRLMFVNRNVNIFRDGAADSEEGSYLLLGHMVLLAGPGGLRDFLWWDQQNGDLTSQSGQVYDYIEPVYGDLYAYGNT